MNVFVSANTCLVPAEAWGGCQILLNWSYSQILSSACWTPNPDSIQEQWALTPQSHFSNLVLGIFDLNSYVYNFLKMHAKTGINYMLSYCSRYISVYFGNLIYSWKQSEERNYAIKNCSHNKVIETIPALPSAAM